MNPSPNPSREPLTRRAAGTGQSKDKVASFTIVVANDFSEASGYAFDQAARVARRVPGSNIHVVNVIESGSTEAEAKRVSDDLIVYLGEKVNALGGLEGHAIGVHVRCGDAADEVAELAKDVGADLLVLASTKGPHLKRILVGSVADRLMAAARCPVLVAGPMPPPKVLEPAVEPACPDCFESRRGSGGRQWWCTRHSQHHAKAHSYSFQRELALRTHDGAVTPTGID